jgi:hypothetical protein
VGSVLLDCAGPYVVEDEVVLALCRHVRAWSRERRSSGRHAVTVQVTHPSPIPPNLARTPVQMCIRGVGRGLGGLGGGGDGVWEGGKGRGGGLDRD